MTDGFDAVGRDRDEWAFGDWVGRRARCSPDVTALVDAETGRRQTYAALDSSVAETAGRLAALGVRAGDHLGTVVGTRVEALELVHAAARIGAVLVPLNPTLPREAVASQADCADVTTLVCSADTEATAVSVADDAGESPVPVASVDESDDDAVAELGGQAPEQADSGVETVERGLEDPATILFTSGTTGDPKAVVLTAGNLLASAVGSAFRLGVSPHDRWFCELPAYHMGGIAPFLRSALYGTTVVVQERDEAFEPERTLENLREYGATGVSLVPTQLRRLLETGSLPSSLRFVLLGGGPASEALIRQCDRRDVPVHPTYGMTETTSQVATARPEEATGNPGTVGRPLAVTDVTIVDEAGDPVAPGETGELVVGGPTVTPRYYGDPARTEAAFGPHGLYTGDLGHRDDGGRLWIHGRVDDLIRTGGETVDPGVVADAIRSIDAVEDAAVVGLSDPEWGERVGALVVLAEEVDQAFDADAIRDACRGTLAPHELPKRVAFAAELPRTASGTVDRDAVRESLRGDDTEE